MPSFRSGGAAQVSSLPADDPLTSDEKRVCFAYTQPVVGTEVNERWVNFSCSGALLHCRWQ